MKDVNDEENVLSEFYFVKWFVEISYQKKNLTHK